MACCTALRDVCVVLASRGEFPRYVRVDQQPRSVVVHRADGCAHCHRRLPADQPQGILQEQEARINTASEVSGRRSAASRQLRQTPEGQLAASSASFFASCECIMVRYFRHKIYLCHFRQIILAESGSRFVAARLACIARLQPQLSLMNWPASLNVHVIGG